VLAMPDPGPDTMRHFQSVSEVPPCAGLLRLLVPRVVVGVFIDYRCVADWVEVTHGVIPATPELFSEDTREEF